MVTANGNQARRAWRASAKQNDDESHDDAGDVPYETLPCLKHRTEQRSESAMHGGDTAW
ncbi:hypothetical protein GCM10009858_42300 [Terrabacter carboxydivorans]|uniref:Uncharacterized protein n=2 Tax=Terrabacter carboxydivorans TaxID=619730 RepID=A0ABP5ZIR0_9MICO